MQPVRSFDRLVADKSGECPGRSALTPPNISDKLAPNQRRSRRGCGESRKGLARMSNHIEDTPISRRKLLKGAAGAVGGLAAGSLFGPELAGAIPRRRLAPTTVVVMSKELTTGKGNTGTPSTSDFEDLHPNIKIELLTVDPAKFQAMMAG